MKAGTYERIYAVVRRIPRGRVATYGQVAALAGLPGHARQVGYALSALTDEPDIPWHRVINARGEISPRTGLSTTDRACDAEQHDLLTAEGITFDDRARISLERYRWRSDPRT
jgi:methylated-DNA-protein-cysteine methyltransferase-like protein